MVDVGESVPEGRLQDPAWRDDPETFQQLAEPYRRELHLHCYRMLGSVLEAEDLVQETFLRAWRARGRFEGRTSFRNWLYRIATNACLNVLARRPTAGRLLPNAVGPPADRPPQGGPTPEIDWLEPYPDALLDAIADLSPGPEARYEMREAVQLAFLAAIQQLPARQRAVLLLRDVLGWSAAETAGLLGASLASANSALQRARATLEARFPSGQPTRPPVTDTRQRALLDRYVRAWEGADLDGFVALLREDAVLTMPPTPEWYLGRDSIGTFFAWVWDALGGGPFRMLAAAANRQPAFAHYIRGRDEPEYHAHALHVLALQDGAIAALTVFRDPRLFAAFGLPPAVGD